MSRVLQAVDSIHSVGLYCLGMQIAEEFLIFLLSTPVAIASKPCKQGTALDVALRHH